MGNTIKPHIRNAEKTGVCQLQKQGLSEFPKELSLLIQNLRTLDLSENRLTNLPAQIESFSHLKVLIINNNRLSHLPPELGKVKKLETMSFSGNHLSILPPTISDLCALRTVNLSNNQLTELPSVFGGLNHLEFLDLSKNRISKITDCVKELTCFELNLNQNQLSFVSEAVSECPRLKVLRLEENCLQLNAIPSKLLTDSNVSLLALEGNLFEQKDLQNTKGYEQYMERYTATKKKMY